MQGREDADGFIAAFSGDHRYIVDYLVEEVLQRQAPAVRNFLLQTSVLDRMSGPLCDAVTGEQGGRAMLESLERANLFVVPLEAHEPRDYAISLVRQWLRSFDQVPAGGRMALESARARVGLLERELEQERAITSLVAHTDTHVAALRGLDAAARADIIAYLKAPQ